MAVKAVATERALEKLRQMCWTIVNKKYVDTEETPLTREEVLGNERDSGALPDSNMGSRLLKKMGWTGGGVGAVGNKGIATPVSADNTNMNREGLGLQAERGISSNFIARIKDTLQNYTRSDNPDDLCFAATFTKEERVIIHKEGQKLGLKTHSHGTGNDRFLALSRKRTPQQLFSHIMKHGGETSKYLLVRPGEYNLFFA